MTGTDGNGVVLATIDKMLPSRATRHWVQSITKERDEQKEKTARAEEAKLAAVLKSRDARRRVRLAARSLKLAAPGIVLSSLGFTFAFGADGNGRVAMMALLLFAAGTVAYVWSISLASGRLKSDSGPGTQGRST